MRNLEQILEILPQLDRVIADELEDQDLDFKEWITRSMDNSVRMFTIAPIRKSPRSSKKSPFRKALAACW